MRKILIASLLGGVVIFVWGAFAHMALPVGEMGMSALPAEEPVLDAFKTNLPAPGMYFFPGRDFHASMTPQQEAAWSEKYTNGPAGILIYRLKGGDPMPPTMLIHELLTNIACGFIAALIAASLAGSYIKRVMLLSLLGLSAWLAVSVSYWIWYHFPATFVFGEAMDVFIGALLAGFVIAKLVPAPRQVA